jgi:hypothetical protein
MAAATTLVDELAGYTDPEPSFPDGGAVVVWLAELSAKVPRRMPCRNCMVPRRTIELVRGHCPDCLDEMPPLAADLRAIDETCAVAACRSAGLSVLETPQRHDGLARWRETVNAKGQRAVTEVRPREQAQSGHVRDCHCSACVVFEARAARLEVAEEMRDAARLAPTPKPWRDEVRARLRPIPVDAELAKVDLTRHAPADAAEIRAIVAGERWIDRPTRSEVTPACSIDAATAQEEGGCEVDRAETVPDPEPVSVAPDLLQTWELAWLDREGDRVDAEWRRRWDAWTEDERRVHMRDAMRAELQRAECEPSPGWIGALSLPFLVERHAKLRLPGRTSAQPRSLRARVVLLSDYRAPGTKSGPLLTASALAKVSIVCGDWPRGKNLTPDQVFARVVEGMKDAISRYGIPGKRIPRKWRAFPDDQWIRTTTGWIQCAPTYRYRDELGRLVTVYPTMPEDAARRKKRRSSVLSPIACPKGMEAQSLANLPRPPSDTAGLP